MKCPNCKNEVSSDWQVCPFCEYRPKKCSNPDCCSDWLPESAEFCPKCGNKIGNQHSNVERTNCDETIAYIIKKKELSLIIKSLLSTAK